MVDITHKVTSLRTAVAQAIVTVSAQATIDAIKEKKVPKGDVFEFSRAAGLLAVKKTSDVIPDCHPLPIEYTGITHRIQGLEVFIEVEVKAIYRTGVEVEAMHGASVVALTMYDMLKPIDKQVEIGSIKLLSKKGGKSQKADMPAILPTCAVIVCSDSVSAGTKQDRSGKTVMEKLAAHGLQTVVYEVIPDDFTAIQQKAKEISDRGIKILLFTGGTGLYKRDVTPDALEPLINRPIPGIMEAARSYGQQRTPYAMLSRGVSGFINTTLVVTLPGSTRGAVETMDAIFPFIIHIFRVTEGTQHPNEWLINPENKS